MTKNEILRADILDILFEKRNKDYGAYALRRSYDKRLWVALGSALSLVFVFIAVNAFDAGPREMAKPVYQQKVIELKDVVIPKEKPLVPEKSKELPKPKEQPKIVQRKVATEKLTSKIDIKPDDQVKEKMPDVTNMNDKEVGDTRIQGAPATTIPKAPDQPLVSGNDNSNTNVPAPVIFTAQERDPQFPGGAEALRRFLASNLQTPTELEDGEKKTVMIRFKVDKDGTVNTFEIVTSGGTEFDQEVVRVCKKMPRWMPALQNGIHVPVNFMLPVTFIGVEQ